MPRLEINSSMKFKEVGHIMDAALKLQKTPYITEAR